MPPMRRVRILVSGRVQGVWFRASARERALALGVDGDARNLADGRVELHAEGTAEAIESFLGVVRRADPPARASMP